MPHDEGAFAQAAERILDGQLPHRDFDDTYTGGLAFLHALAFKLFGVRLLSMRWMLLVFSLVFIPAAYAIAAHVARPIVAGLMTLLCVALSLPNYFAPVPSWYNLFFATFGTLALLRHIETGGRRWLFIAGALGGASFLIKSIGLFYVAAVLIFLLYREQGESATTTRDARTWGFGLFSSAGLLVFAGLLMVLIWRQPGLVPFQQRAMELFHFAVPGLALCGLLIGNEWSVPRGNSWQRLRRVLHLLAPFLAGLAIPVAAFLLPYVLTSGLDELVTGVFLLPLRRFTSSSYPLPPWRRCSGRFRSCACSQRVSCQGAGPAIATSPCRWRWPWERSCIVPETTRSISRCSGPCARPPPCWPSLA